MSEICNFQDGDLELKKIKEKLKRQRDELAASAGYLNEDFKVEWWRRLSIDDRRTLAVLAGAADDEEAVSRGWLSMSSDTRTKLLTCAGRWARALAPMRLE